MNEKFIFDEIICYLNATEPTGKYEQHVIFIKQALEKKERQDKLLNILKEKRVDLCWIGYKVLDRNYTIQELVEEYNAFYKNIKLNIEEMTLIMEWLKENQMIIDGITLHFDKQEISILTAALNVFGDEAVSIDQCPTEYAIKFFALQDRFNDLNNAIEKDKEEESTSKKEEKGYFEEHGYFPNLAPLKIPNSIDEQGRPVYRDFEKEKETGLCACLCACYDNGRCNGTKNREECYCKGDVEDCTFYKEN